MPDLIAIAYPDTSTALSAMDEVQLSAEELAIQPDAVAVVIRGRDGRFRTITEHHEVGAGAAWGLFWGFLFGVLFFVPVLGMVLGAAFGALAGKLARSSIAHEFQEQVREAMQPGTSALFLIVDHPATEAALEGLSVFGGEIIRTTLSAQDAAEIQAALHGDDGS